MLTGCDLPDGENGCTAGVNVMWNEVMRTRE